jgi:phospholipid/cholesterol/gamma-HCH transport system substrate-binding protein
MKRDNVNYVLVGAVVAAAMVLLLAALAAITGRSGASTDYLVHYHRVAGLRDGAPVFYEGYRIGAVGAITPERRATGTVYRVTLALRRDWPIPKDSVARLQSSGLLADVSIGIREGKSRDMLAPGAELQGVEGSDVFAAMNELAAEVTTLTRTRLTPLVNLLSQRVGSITETIDRGTPELMRQTSGLLERMTRASDGLNDVLKPENRAAVDALLGNARSLSGELRNTRARLDAALVELGAIAKENRPEVRHAVADLGKILAALSSRMDAITHHLDSASRNLDQFSREIRRNPNRLLLSPPADDVDADAAGGNPQ